MSYSGKYSGVFPTTYNGIFGSGASGGFDIADLFSTDVYAGTGAPRDIVNGIDMTTEDALVWLKSRGGVGTTSHFLFDTQRGAGVALSTNSTAGEQDVTVSGFLTSFNADGYSLGANTNINGSSGTYAGWSFRKAPKFFDIIKYVGDGVAGREIPHGLGVQAGMVVVKKLGVTSPWYVQHVSRGGSSVLFLNNDSPTSTGGSGWWNSTGMTDTEVTLGNNSNVNAIGNNYIMYVFAHDTADDGIVQCGQYVGNGSFSGTKVTLGWQPQFVLIKRATGGTANWAILDTTRGINPPGGNDPHLDPNVNSPEFTERVMVLDSDGFTLDTDSSNFNLSATAYIYMAIRAEA